VSHRVSITPTAQKSVRALRGKARSAFDAAIVRLATEGCKAGDYRLTGDDIEHICSVQIYGRHRILVCFPEEGSVVVLLVGEHLRDSPDLDVYRSLYRALGLPEPSGERTKPPCCNEDGEAPIDSDLLDRFRVGAKALARRGRSK
jgi:hypothetical protein